jgi:hypothetical protein
MPKVHRRKAILRHIKSDLGTTIDPHEIDPQWPVVDVEMQRGDVLLMNRFTPHRTQPNNSEKVRCFPWRPSLTSFLGILP